MTKLLTLDETADYLRVSPRTVRRLVKRRELVASRVGGAGLRFREDELERYLDANTVGV